MAILAGDTIAKNEYRNEFLKLKEAIKTGGSYSGVITAQQLSNGSYVALSCYSDRVWIVNPKTFPVSTPESRRKIDFTTLPNCFVERAKRLVAIDIAKRLKGSTTFTHYGYLESFLKYLDSINIRSTTEITPLVAMQYVEHSKSIRQKWGRKRKGKPLSKKTLLGRFKAVERLHEALVGTVHQFAYPWPESGATNLAGIKHKYYKTPRTQVIPDDVFVAMFRYANGYLERANELLSLRDTFVSLEGQLSKRKRLHEKQKLLKEKGYETNLTKFNQELKLLESSCFLIILATSGIRVHEFAGLKANSYHSRDDDGEVYYFIESESLKTGEGETSWLVPKIAIDALEAMTRITQPLRDRLVKDIESAEGKGQDLKADNLRRIQHSCVLSVNANTNNAVGILTNASINERLRKLAESAGIEWYFSCHQFRRTFAHFVIHNQLGDLRYLRDHFKHWSLDMTSLYALDDNLDLDLFNDINFAYREKGENILEHWMDSNTPIAGGLKDRIIALRNSHEAVKTYGSRVNMMTAMSDNIIVRSTGIAWCTNDTFGCGGGRCEDCGHSVIDDSFQHQWEAIYDQQIELRKAANELGPGGLATIERTIKRCEAVLVELGADMRTIKERVAAHA